MENNDRVLTFFHSGMYRNGRIRSNAGNICLVQIQPFGIDGLNGKSDNPYKEHELMKICGNVMKGYGKLLARYSGYSRTSPNYFSMQKFYQEFESYSSITELIGKIICVSEIKVSGSTSRRLPGYVNSDGTDVKGKFVKNKIENLHNCELRSVGLYRVEKIDPTFSGFSSGLRNEIRDILIKGRYPDFESLLKEDLSKIFEIDEVENEVIDTVKFNPPRVVIEKSAEIITTETTTAIAV